MQWEKDSKSLQQMVLGKLDRHLTPHTKINSKWINNLNVRPETIKILEQSTDSNVSDIRYSNIFLDTSLEARETKAKMNFWDFIKIKKLLHSKRNSQ